MVPDMLYGGGLVMRGASWRLSPNGHVEAAQLKTIEGQKIAFRRASVAAVIYN